ncbi:hypothetical protein KI387_028692, partial [Taxus chinensis]
GVVGWAESSQDSTACTARLGYSDRRERSAQGSGAAFTGAASCSTGTDRCLTGAASPGSGTGIGSTTTSTTATGAGT